MFAAIPTKRCTSGDQFTKKGAPPAINSRGARLAATSAAIHGLRFTCRSLFTTPGIPAPTRSLVLAVASAELVLDCRLLRPELVHSFKLLSIASSRASTDWPKAPLHDATLALCFAPQA